MCCPSSASGVQTRPLAGAGQTPKPRPCKSHFRAGPVRIGRAARHGWPSSRELLFDRGCSAGLPVARRLRPLSAGAARKWLPTHTQPAGVTRRATLPANAPQPRAETAPIDLGTQTLVRAQKRRFYGVMAPYSQQSLLRAFECRFGPRPSAAALRPRQPHVVARSAASIPVADESAVFQFPRIVGRLIQATSGNLDCRSNESEKFAGLGKSAL